MGSGVGGSLLTVFALQLSINVLLMEEDPLDLPIAGWWRGGERREGELNTQSRGLDQGAHDLLP